MRQSRTGSVNSSFRKELFPAIIVFMLFIFATFLVNSASASARSPECGIFEIKPGCDLSGWMKFIMGDILIGIFLALLLHHFSRRNSEKLQKIIVAGEKMKNTRRDYAIQSLKNHLTTVLFIMGIINRMILGYNKEASEKSRIYTSLKGEEARLNRIMQTARNTIVYSSDTLDPTLVDQLDGILTFISQLSIAEIDGKLDLPKYEQSKAKILDITKKLQDYAIAVHEPKE